MPISYPSWLTSKKKPLPRKAPRGPIGAPDMHFISGGPLSDQLISMRQQRRFPYRPRRTKLLPLRTRATLPFCLRGACGQYVCVDTPHGAVAWVPA